MTGDEMVGWHHRLKGHEFEQTLGDCEGQGSLALWQAMGSQSQTWMDMNSNKGSRGIRL